MTHRIRHNRQHAGSFSAAFGIHIWRGGSFLAVYTGCAFSCDPTGNLVHADKLVPHGAAFAAEPLLNGMEFLASRDDWFWPVYLARGPDQSLYVADMFRKIIEHPDYLPQEVRKHTDFETGKELGRIWRVSAKAWVENNEMAVSSVSEEAWLAQLQPSETQAAEVWLAERLSAASSR